jgi:hypothetical protein
VTLTLISQEAIDKMIETRLDALESVVVLLGDEVQAMKTRMSLRCHSSTNGFVSQLNLMSLSGAGNV